MLSILKAQIETVVAPLVAGQLAKDMEELLHLAPKEVKLSQIANEMRKRHEGEGWGPVITVEVQRTEYGSAWVYLDEGEHHDSRAEHQAEHRLLIGKDGVITGGWIDHRPMQDGQYVGRSYGLAQKIRAYVACGTKIILDEDAVVTSVGDY